MDVGRTNGTRRRVALLVGVDRTAHLQLWGPTNDVDLVRATVCVSWGFEVNVLVDRRATRDGILGALAAIAAPLHVGDLLLFYFAGHGSRIPDREKAGVVHEALCPHDIGDRHAGAIADHELHDVFTDVAERGIGVTAIFDCCFAGGMPSERLRGSALAVRSLDRADEAAPSDEVLRGVTTTRMFDVPRLRGASIVAFGACAADSVAHERAFGKQIRGVFTHHLVEAAMALPPDFSNGDLLRRTTTGMHATTSGEASPQTPILAPPSCADDRFLGGAFATNDAGGEA